MDRFLLKCQFRFESARSLPFLPPSHPCSRVHGHSFRLEVYFEGGLKDETWVEDYHLVSNSIEKNILQKLDHRLLNEVPGLENPSTEILCRWIFVEVRKFLPSVVQIRISETPETECRYPSRLPTL